MQNRQTNESEDSVSRKEEEDDNEEGYIGRCIRCKKWKDSNGVFGRCNNSNSDYYMEMTEADDSCGKFKSLK